MTQQHGNEPTSAADAGTGLASAGWWYTWWRGDPLPAVPALPGFAAAPVDELQSLAAVTGFAAATVQGLLRDGHHPYLAQLDGIAVGWGWCATRAATIGELSLTFALPSGSRYLWGFATLPAWRCRGIYARLLQAILLREADAARFWIGHEDGNTPSARGILAAGFRRVGEVRHLPGGRLGLLADPPDPPNPPDPVDAPDAADERMAAALALLGIARLTRLTR